MKLTFLTPLLLIGSLAFATEQGQPAQQGQPQQKPPVQQSPIQGQPVKPPVQQGGVQGQQEQKPPVQQQGQQEQKPPVQQQGQQEQKPPVQQGGVQGQPAQQTVPAPEQGAVQGQQNQQALPKDMPKMLVIKAKADKDGAETGAMIYIVDRMTKVGDEQQAQEITQDLDRMSGMQYSECDQTQVPTEVQTLFKKADAGNGRPLTWLPRWHFWNRGVYGYGNNSYFGYSSPRYYGNYGYYSNGVTYPYTYGNYYYPYGGYNYYYYYSPYVH